MSETRYEQLVEAARTDERVLGLVLTGSRGRGAFVREDSDWDVRLVVSGDALSKCEERYETPHGSPVEVAVYSPEQFEQAGELGSPNEWDRYSYVHAKVVLDKDGTIAERVARKSVLPENAAEALAAGALDAYINSYHRSAKNGAAVLAVEAHLDAAESVAPFLTTLFAVHQRVRPFNKYLRWELESFPLGDELWNPDILLPRLDAIVATGGLAPQQSLFRDAEALARQHGLGHVVDSWGRDAALLRG
jgi:predicted nucleotidyltransferase